MTRISESNALSILSRLRNLGRTHYLRRPETTVPIEALSAGE